MRSPAVLNTRDACSSVTAMLGVSVMLLGGTAALAQAPASAPSAQHAKTDAADQNKPLADRIAELRVQVAKLQAVMQRTGPGKNANPNSGMNTSSGPGSMTSSAQAPADPQGQHATADAADREGQRLMNQITELRTTIASLQAAVQQPAPGKKPSVHSGMPTATTARSKGKAAMGGTAPPASAVMTAGGGMGMKDDQGEMGGMSSDETAGMSKAPADAMGLCCTGEMGGMSGSGMAGMDAPSSAMPGQPGASHLYHVGSTGFFLNHSQHITLTEDQRASLNRLKENAMLNRASEQRQIDQVEQQLYTLTGADQLDNSKVQAKLGEIERLRAQQRMNIIQAVGEASKVLTHDQHQALVGTMGG